MAEKRKSDPKQVFDVSHPGTSAPSATSKSVIVTKHALMQDPMVSGAADDAAPEVTKSAPSHKLTLQPLSSQPPTGTDHIPDSDVKASDVETSVEVSVQPTKTEIAPEPVTTDEPASSTAIVDTASEKATEPAAPTNDPTANTNPDLKLEEDEKKQSAYDASLQKLVDSKQYFLPINSAEKLRTKRFILLGISLSIILGVAWADIALDAGLVHIGDIKAVTHFFSN